MGQQALSIFLHVRVADVSHVSQAECKEYSASVASNCDSTTLTSLLMYQLSHITRSFWIQSERTIQPKGVEVKNFKRSCNTIIHIRSKTMIGTVSTKILLASISACESSLANAKRINTIVPNKRLITIPIFVFVLIFTIHTTNAFLPHYGWYFSALQHTHTYMCSVYVHIKAAWLELLTYEEPRMRWWQRRTIVRREALHMSLAVAILLATYLTVSPTTSPSQEVWECCRNTYLIRI